MLGDRSPGGCPNFRPRLRKNPGLLSLAHGIFRYQIPKGHLRPESGRCLDLETGLGGSALTQAQTPRQAQPEPIPRGPRSGCSLRGQWWRKMLPAWPSGPPWGLPPQTEGCPRASAGLCLPPMCTHTRMHARINEHRHRIHTCIHTQDAPTWTHTCTSFIFQDTILSPLSSPLYHCSANP